MTTWHKKDNCQTE